MDSRPFLVLDLTSGVYGHPLVVDCRWRATFEVPVHHACDEGATCAPIPLRRPSRSGVMQLEIPASVRGIGDINRLCLRLDSPLPGVSVEVMGPGRWPLRGVSLEIPAGTTARGFTEEEQIPHRVELRGVRWRAWTGGDSLGARAQRVVVHVEREIAEVLGRGYVVGLFLSVLDSITLHPQGVGWAGQFERQNEIEAALTRERLDNTTALELCCATGCPTAAALIAVAQARRAHGRDHE